MSNEHMEGEEGDEVENKGELVESPLTHPLTHPGLSDQLSPPSCLPELCGDLQQGSPILEPLPDS